MITAGCSRWSGGRPARSDLAAFIVRDGPYSRAIHADGDQRLRVPFAVAELEIDRGQFFS